MRRTILVLCAAASAAGLIALAVGGGGSVAASVGVDPCEAIPARSVTAAAAEAQRRVAAGEALVTVDGNRLVAVGSPGRVGVALVSAVPGMVRHVAAAPGFGTAYVADRKGPDTVVALTPGGTLTFPQHAEATHPAWSPGGDLAWSVGTGLRVRSAAGGGIRHIPSPVRGGRLFSPLFSAEHTIVAVLSAPPNAAVPEDERLNDLWRFDLAGRTWHRVTAFAAGADRWSAIRTPMRRPGGGVEFVRIVGRASATRPPTFQLWALAHGRARELRSLPVERYLAGEAGGRRLWNVPDPRTGRFRLVREAADGGETLIGCGSVMADPLDTVDPDRRAARGRFTPPRGHWPGLEDASAPGSASPVEVGILVGDYATRAQAQAAAARMTAVLGPDAPVSVVDASSAPDAIRPGAFGALLTLDAGADVMTALTEFRTRLPEFAASSWVVSP